MSNDRLAQLGMLLQDSEESLAERQAVWGRLSSKDREIVLDRLPANVRDELLEVSTEVRADLAQSLSGGSADELSPGIYLLRLLQQCGGVRPDTIATNFDSGTVVIDLADRYLIKWRNGNSFQVETVLKNPGFERLRNRDVGISGPHGISEKGRVVLPTSLNLTSSWAVFHEFQKGGLRFALTDRNIYLPADAGFACGPMEEKRTGQNGGSRRIGLTPFIPRGFDVNRKLVFYGHGPYVTVIPEGEPDLPGEAQLRIEMAILKRMNKEVRKL